VGWLLHTPPSHAAPWLLGVCAADTVSAKHDIGALFDLLEPRGKLVMVGLPPDTLEIPHFPLVLK
jgi:D-arabinose 1-dehydrogenase-like Zn-dependent alcohol dehydrogenase